MATGNGKIANLPGDIREALNWRINDGAPGNELVEWLNAKPEVAEVMRQRFDGCPISEQNLSEWRKRGYQQWLAFHNLLDESNAISENAESIAESGINCEKLLLMLTASYAAMIQRWNITPAEEMTYKMGVFKNLTAAVLVLRRAELQAIHLQIARERLELLREKRAGKSDSAFSSPASSSSQTPPGHSSSAESTDTSGPLRPEARAFSHGAPTAAQSEPENTSGNTAESIPGRANDNANDGNEASPRSQREGHSGAPAESQGLGSTSSAPPQRLPRARSSRDTIAAPAATPPAHPQAIAQTCAPSREPSRVGGRPSTISPRNPLGLL